MAAKSPLFPFVLLRIAGAYMSDWRQTDFTRAADVATQIIQCEKTAAKLGDTLCDDLYKLVPNVQNHTQRQRWMHVRRSAYNRRPISIAEADLSDVPSDTKKRLQQYSRQHELIKTLILAGERGYKAELSASRRLLAKLLQQSNFLNGILLSSDTIGYSLEKYIADAPQDTPVTKKERSFVEYLSRMHTKPSPFSSFTHLSMATFGPAKQKPLLVSSSDARITSHVQLNHKLYEYLRSLLIQHPAIRQHLQVVPNMTIRKTDNIYFFLTNHRNQEAFQQITSTPSLDVIYRLTTGAAKPTTYSDLVHNLLSKGYIRATRHELERYIDQLLEVGFFEFDLGISGINSSWASSLATLITSFAPHWPESADVADGLLDVQRLAGQYSSAPANERSAILNQAFHIIESTCHSLGATSSGTKPPSSDTTVFRHTHNTDFTIKRHELWYEDTKLESQNRLSPDVKAALNDLRYLLKRSTPCGCQQAMTAMTQFFTASYNGKAAVPVLQFYRDYSQHKKLAASDNTSSTAKHPELHDTVLARYKAQLGSKGNDGIVNVRRSDIADLPTTIQSASCSIFFQAYEEKDGVNIVVNGLAPGYGKLFSRFLYLFDDSVTDSLRPPKTSRPDKILMAEVTDASFFNANLHPRIMPYEITTPGGHAALPATAQLSVQDLAVVYDTQHQRLKLEHTPTKKEVVPFDLGFQGKGGRSELYNLLGLFNHAPHATVGGLTDCINRHVSDQKTILPRIVYEGRVTLQRKTWKLAKTTLPTRKSQETDWSYFLRLCRWHQDNGIPEEVFVRSGASKPQYISFRNPFLVAVLESILRGSEKTLIIEEMLPSSDHLFKVGEEARVVEFLAQLDIS